MKKQNTKVNEESNEAFFEVRREILAQHDNEGSTVWACRRMNDAEFRFFVLVSGGTTPDLAFELMFPDGQSHGESPDMWLARPLIRTALESLKNEILKDPAATRLWCLSKFISIAEDPKVPAAARVSALTAIGRSALVGLYEEGLLAQSRKKQLRPGSLQRIEALVNQTLKQADPLEHKEVM